MPWRCVPTPFALQVLTSFGLQVYASCGLCSEFYIEEDHNNCDSNTCTTDTVCCCGVLSFTYDNNVLIIKLILFI